MQQHTHPIRVRYDECDPMGFVHHSHYLKYFEIARTEMYRASGGNYVQNLPVMPAKAGISGPGSRPGWCSVQR